MAEAPPQADNVARRGIMLVLSSPSGAGKTTLSRRLLETDPLVQLAVSVPRRRKGRGEVDGGDYHFIDQALFDAMGRNGDLLESARVFDHCYGTPRPPVQAALAAGRDVLFDVDWQGTQQLRDHAEADLVSVFVLPPSVAELERRLKGGGQGSDDVIRRRMSKASGGKGHWAGA